MDLNKTVNVKNRGTSSVGYTLPDSGIRRTWSPGEIKKGLSVGELEQITYVPGGFTLIQDYLLINDSEVCEYLNLQTEPEYFYTEVEVGKLLSTGTLEQFLDCLDFAPDGVIDLIKKMAINTNLNDVSKREALKAKTGLDVSKAIDNKLYSETKDEPVAGEGKKRRVAIDGTETTVASGRRSAPVNAQPPVYNRVEN